MEEKASKVEFSATITTKEHYFIIACRGPLGIDGCRTNENLGSN